jgi:hypothetical protein
LLRQLFDEAVIAKQSQVTGVNGTRMILHKKLDSTVNLAIEDYLSKQILKLFFILSKTHLVFFARIVRGKAPNRTAYFYETGDHNIFFLLPGYLQSQETRQGRLDNRFHADRGDTLEIVTPFDIHHQRRS